METNKQKAYKEALAKGDVVGAILIAQNKSKVVVTAKPKKVDVVEEKIVVPSKKKTKKHSSK